MRWITFVIAAVLVVSLQTSLVDKLFTLDSLGELWPSLVGMLLVFVSMFAPKALALWAAWGLGLLYDLSLVQASRVLVGPHALGFAFGAYLVIQLRSMVFRRRLLTLAVMTLIGLSASGVLEVALLTVRSWMGDPVLAAGFSPLGELGRRLGVALYSALLMIPVGWLLLQSLPLWSFQQVSERR